MDHHEYRELREGTGMTQLMASEYFGVSLRTINGREAGTTKITHEAALAMRSTAKTISRASDPRHKKPQRAR